MLDLRQLKFFVVSADIGSFSEASKVLYTTQSAISKSVAALERQLGFELFLHGGRGISLTEKGASFYLRANELLTSAESLEREAEEKSNRYVNLAANPGTWFADNFAEFYDVHQDEQLHFRILTDSTSQVMRWVKNGAAELGFVFVFPDDNGQFDYDLRRYQLQFEALRTVNGMLYMSPEHMSGMQKSSRDSGKQTSEKKALGNQTSEKSDSEKPCREDHHAAGDGDREEIAANPRHDKSCKKSKEPGKRPACCRENCGKGHHGQRDVRNIEQK